MQWDSPVVKLSVWLIELGETLRVTDDRRHESVFNPPRDLGVFVLVSYVVVGTLWWRMRSFITEVWG